MSRVEQNGGSRSAPQASKAPHIHDQISVPERRAPFRHSEILAPTLPHFLHCARHLLRSHPLALLHIDGKSGCPGGEEQVGLTAEERGNLQGVHHVGRGTSLLRPVHVGEKRESSRVAHPLEGP